jgi:hypothetical protein
MSPWVAQQILGERGGGAGRDWLAFWRRLRFDLDGCGITSPDMSVRVGVSWVLWFVSFFWLWMFLAADWNRIEWIAGACVAAVAATIAEPLRRAAGVRLLVPRVVLRASALVFPMVFVDFGILVWVLARSLAARQVIRGRYLSRPFESGPKTTPAGVAHRAWTVLLAGYSPNAYVVDIDPDRGVVLLHDLVPYRRSEEPA